VVSVVDGETDAAPDGLQQLQAMPGGGFKAPIGQTLGLDLVEVERGRVVFEGKPDRSVYNRSAPSMAAMPRRCSTAPAGSPRTPRSVRAAAPRRAASRARRGRMRSTSGRSRNLLEGCSYEEPPAASTADCMLAQPLAHIGNPQHEAE